MTATWHITLRHGLKFWNSLEKPYFGMRNSLTSFLASAQIEISLEKGVVPQPPSIEERILNGVSRRLAGRQSENLFRKQECHSGRPSVRHDREVSGETRIGGPIKARLRTLGWAVPLPVCLSDLSALLLISLTSSYSE